MYGDAHRASRLSYGKWTEAKIRDLWRQSHVSPERLMRKRGKLSVWDLNREDKRRELIILRGFRVLSKVKRLDHRPYKR